MSQATLHRRVSESGGGGYGRENDQGGYDDGYESGRDEHDAHDEGEHDRPRGCEHENGREYEDGREHENGQHRLGLRFQIAFSTGLF